MSASARTAPPSREQLERAAGVVRELLEEAARQSDAGSHADEDAESAAAGSEDGAESGAAESSAAESSAASSEPAEPSGVTETAEASDAGETEPAESTEAAESTDPAEPSDSTESTEASEADASEVEASDATEAETGAAADGSAAEPATRASSRPSAPPRGPAEPGRLADLVHDVVARQCETRTLITGEPYVRARAVAHDVERADAGTPLGNVLTILERGAEDSLEWSLLSVLYVTGIARRAAELSGEDERRALSRRVASSCVWLELATPHRVFSLWPMLLPPELCARLYGALGEQVLEDDGDQAEAAARGRNAVRIAALCSADGDAAHDALGRIADGARDPFSRTLAALGLGRLASDAAGRAEHQLQGQLGRFPGGGLRSTLRWLSGWALLSWVLRLLGSIVGLRRSAEVELRGQALTIRRRISLLGRPIRAVEHTHSLRDLRSARRAARYPFVHLLVGVLCFSGGLVLGGLFLFDAARAGDLTLLLFAAALWLGGAGLDLALDVLVPARLGRVALDLDLGRVRTRLVGVEQGAADRLLQTLAARLAEPSTSPTA